MKKIYLAAFLLLLVLPCFAQYQGRLSSDDQQRFDSYYQRWQDYKRTNNRSEIASMEQRMQDVMRRNNIPTSTPYDRIASSGQGGNNYNRYRNVLSSSDQQKFDSYYSRWQDYRRTNNRDEIISMEKRMHDLMVRYKIPLTVSYDDIATNGSSNNGGWNKGGWNRWHGRLNQDDQNRFDSYYSRWQDYKRRNDRDQIRSMEDRMRDVMRKNKIPDNVSFDQIASNGQNRY